jgi:L-fuculokinase
MTKNIYLIFDIGKTNKKCFVFDENANVLDEYAEKFVETKDEDGFPCDDVQQLKEWILGQYELLLKNKQFKIVGINFATYGASFVHLDNEGHPLTPLYNYLKPYPTEIHQQFLTTFFNGTENDFAVASSSPSMQMLNSGLQLYWLKHAKPAIWKKVTVSLHLPQYLSYLFTNKFVSDFTSIGCHTGLWDFEKQSYLDWVTTETIDQKLAPFNNSLLMNDQQIAIGAGLHDSSSALIPYLQQHKDPFMLISTGTWCINLNPFNGKPLNADEMRRDSLCFLQVNGKPVKASRIFLGKEHEYQVERIAQHFNLSLDFYKAIKQPTQLSKDDTFIPACMEGSGPMPEKQTTIWQIAHYQNADEAYTALMQGLILLLKQSIDLINSSLVKQFFIDGGFAANPLFVYYLRQLYPHKQIQAVAFPQATALGAYLHLKECISKKEMNMATTST